LPNAIFWKAWWLKMKETPAMQLDVMCRIAFPVAFVIFIVIYVVVYNVGVEEEL
jgi:uncharacterized membrane protein